MANDIREFILTEDELYRALDNLCKNIRERESAGEEMLLYRNEYFFPRIYHEIEMRNGE